MIQEQTDIDKRIADNADKLYLGLIELDYKPDNDGSIRVAFDFKDSDEEICLDYSVYEDELDEDGWIAMNEPIRVLKARNDGHFYMEVEGGKLDNEDYPVEEMEEFVNNVLEYIRKSNN